MEPSAHRTPEFEETFHALRRVMAVFRGRFAGVLGEHGITIPQWLIMKALRRAGRMTGSELAEACGMTAANVTGIVDRLEAANLVTRAKNPDDRRVVFVRLTELGHEKMERIVDVAESSLSALFEGWNEHELRELRERLGRLRLQPDDPQDL